MNSIRRSALILFFALAYAFTWARWLPEAAANRGLIDFDVPFGLELLGGYGPLLAAVIMTVVIAGKAGLKDLGARLIRWRVRPQWYLVVLLVPVLIQGVGLLLKYQVSGQTIALNPERMPLAELLSFFPMLLLGFDGLGEEVGWRGFALPGLLNVYSPLISSLVLGVLWGFWHLPYSLASGGFLADTPIYLVIANTIGLAVLHTWIFYHVRGSILIAILFHAWNNMLSIFLGNWLVVSSDTSANLVPLIVQSVFVVGVILFAHPFQLASRLSPRLADEIHQAR